MTRVPRMRGDEPVAGGFGPVQFEVFPACAGMNRSRGVYQWWHCCVPRMRGDEPYPNRN